MMKYTSLFFALSLALLGCGCRDSQLKKEVVGSWMEVDDTYFKLKLSPDGSFVWYWSNTNKSMTYQGTWKIQTGRIFTTVTNCIHEGFTNFEPIGSADIFTILRADSTSMVYSNENQQYIISFRRE
jgi:hypothetical protein